MPDPGHTHTEAAEILGVNANTVRSRLARAQRIVEARWRRRGNDLEEPA